jgi:phenylalanyl-tRNA synthetase alpha chain
LLQLKLGAGVDVSCKTVPNLLQESSRGPLVFKPFSKHPPCYKDISFWIGSEQFTDNNFFEVVRGEAGDIAERVDLV